MKHPKSSRIQSSIDVHIEELVLHGFAPGDRYAVADAVQQELAQLLQAQGMSSELDGDYNTIDAGSFEVRHGESSAGVGAQVARAVYQELLGGEPSRDATRQSGPANSKPY